MNQKDTTRRLWGLPGAVFALGAVSLLTDFSSEMIYPLLPAFLSAVLKAGPLALGAIEGVAEATASLLKLFSGWATDRTGRRKPLVVAGYGLSGAARPLIGLATVWPIVLLFRFLDRVGKGLRTSPRDALIADVVSPEFRGAAYGLHRGMDHLGAVLGPLAAAGLLTAGCSYRTVFFSAAIPGLVVLWVLWQFVPETAGVRPTLSGHTSASTFPKPRAWGFMVTGLFIHALGTPADVFLLLRLTEAGLSSPRVALLWSAHSLIRAASVMMAGRLADRLPRGRLVLGGWLIRALVFAFIGLDLHRGGIVGLFLAYALVAGVTEPAERALIAGIVGQPLRGRAFGVYHATLGLGALPAGLIFGGLWSGGGPSWAFGLACFLVCLSAGVVFVPARRHLLLDKP